MIWSRAGVRLLGLVLAIAACWPARTAQAKDFSVSRQWLFDARADDLLAVILAYDQACDHGCRFRAPHVTQALVLPHKRTPDDFFVWTFVEDVQNTTFFSHVTVKRERGRIRVSFRLVGPKRAAELTQASGKPHDPNFDDSLATYELEEVLENGRFQKTRVRYENKLTLSGLGAVFGASVVRDRLDEDVRFTFQNLGTVKARPKAEASGRPQTGAKPAAGARPEPAEQARANPASAANPTPAATQRPAVALRAVDGGASP